MITAAEYVLFDFDGPICRLFAGHQAHEVADSLVDWLEERGRHVLLTKEELASDDPHAVLRAVGRISPGSELVEALEEELTREELQATVTARPTPWADPLIRTWRAVLGGRLAITTNNSPQVARQYLAGRGLAECFLPHVYGRTTDLSLLKPDPDCLNRALAGLGARPDQALMIGDTPSDLYAAQRADVPFLGYARDEWRRERLRAAGAEVVVDDLEQVLDLVRSTSRA
ncbi:HAD family hydrolase [Streptomyces sp. 21So2-11]|uniref:HAD family hydrolase n=1 Tax=Streptomyces sp. 21So2-11 TaxID=3144408 RepID=UPI00321ADC8F